MDLVADLTEHSDYERVSQALPSLNANLGQLTAIERIKWAVRLAPDRIIATTSFGLHSSVMLHLVTTCCPDIPVVFVDTGYLFPETYVFANKLTKRFGLNLKTYTALMSPAHQEALHGELWNQGLDGLKKYHLINKIEPMDRALKELGAVVWLTGVRRAQSSTRESFQCVMLQNKVLKVAPIVDWSDADVTQYLQANGLPIHPLGNQGYVSIGDRHTSRKLEPGMKPEETRFHGLKRECGLHEPSKIPGYRL